MKMEIYILFQNKYRRHEAINCAYPSLGLSMSRLKLSTLLYDGPPHGGERNATSP